MAFTARVVDSDGEVTDMAFPGDPKLRIEIPYFSYHPIPANAVELAGKKLDVEFRKFSLNHGFDLYTYIEE